MKRVAFRPLRPHTTIAQIVKTPALDVLTHGEIVVYLRLVAASAHGGVYLRLKNQTLHHDVRTARRALLGLKKRGLIRIRYKRGDSRERDLVLL